MKDREVIEYLRSRVVDGSNRLQSNHVDLVERRLKEELNIPESHVVIKPSLVKPLLTGLLLIIVLVAGQLDLVELIATYVN